LTCADNVIIGEAQMILQVAPTHWYSHDFTVHHASRQLADVDVAFWREEGLLTAEGVRYRVCRESWMSGVFVLQRDGSVIARAEKPSAFFRTYLIRYGDRQYTLRARSAFQRAFVLLDGSRQIGTIEPHNPFTNKATADLPESWPPAVRAFVIWLTMIQWRREQS
jgi:hypothetical protein